MKKEMITKIGSSLMFPILALSLLLLSPHLLSNVDNSEANNVKQDSTFQDSPIIIVGKVVDLDHQPLEGVMVRDNSTTIEIMSDTEGKFELSFDTATVVSFTKLGFYNLDHNITESDSSLVVIMTFEPNELILEGYGNPIEKNDEEGWLETDTTSTEDNDVKGWFETDTTSTLKKKYDAMRDSIDNKSMKMENWVDKMDSTHMDKKDNMQWNDSLKNAEKDMWKKDMKHDMDSTKDQKHLYHHKNDTTNKLNNDVIDMK